MSYVSKKDEATDSASPPGGVVDDVCLEDATGLIDEIEDMNSLPEMTTDSPSAPSLGGMSCVHYSTTKKANGGSSSQESVNFLPPKDRSGSQISDGMPRSSSSDYQECVIPPECADLSTPPDGPGGTTESTYCLASDVTPPGREGLRTTSSTSSMKGSASDTSHATTPNNKISKSGSEKKKKGSSWYNVLSPTYKSRSEDFKRIFKGVSNDERLIVDYSCALQKDILVQGRLYIAQNHVCFYANIFRWETVLTIRYEDITAITKERTARVIPNAIQICTRDDKYFFTSFGARDKTYVMLFRVWQNALLEQPMTPQELWQWVHYNYGEELGLTSSDDDYLPPSQDEELSFTAKLQTDEVSTSGATSAEQSSSPQSNKQPPDGAEANGGDLPRHTLHASMQNVAEAVTLNGSGGGTGDAPCTPPRVVRPVTLQVPDVDGSGGTSTNLITDQGDTTTDDDEEVLCEGHEHKNIQCLDEVFAIPIDKMFEILFSDSQLFRAFMEARKTSDLQMTSWTDPDSDGNRSRELKFTLALNYTLGPKCSYSHEKQTWYSSSRPGLSYLIDAEFFNSGIPYGENFYVINRYCLTRVGSQKCRLRVTSEINFRKKVWALVRNYIDKNATIGIMQNFEMLAEHLHRESECLSEAVPSSTAGPPSTAQPGRKKVRRKKRPTSTERTTKRLSDISITKHPQVSAPKGVLPSDEWVVKFNMDTLARIFCIVLVCLVIFNAVLFVKLRSLESMTCVAPFSRDNIFPDARDYPKSQDEWLRLLERQQFLHDTEIKRWKEVLAVVIKLMDQMKLTLVELEQSVARTSTVESSPVGT